MSAVPAGTPSLLAQLQQLRIETSKQHGEGAFKCCSNQSHCSDELVVAEEKEAEERFLEVLEGEDVKEQIWQVKSKTCPVLE